MPWIFLVVGLGGGALIVEFFVFEMGYYFLSVEERFLHPRHDWLRPSGTLGLTIGIAGTTLMVINLSYLVRKRLAKIVWLGTLRSWMAFHVLTGLIGPALILLHSGFTLRSPLATLALVAMVVVVVTGVLGRSIYALVPRSIEGKELDLADVHRTLSRTLADLSALGVGEGLLTVAGIGGDRENDESDRHTGFLASLADVVLHQRRLRAAYRELRRQVLADTVLRPEARKILRLAKRLCRERRWHSRYHQIRRVMGTWRFFHRWLAIVMLLMVTFHVVVAVRHGELWIFGATPR